MCFVTIYKILKNSWHKFSINSQPTQKCLDVLNRLFCYDCDGDVGQGLRNGLCSNVCDQIYQNCKEDYFIIKDHQIQLC